MVMSIFTDIFLLWQQYGVRNHVVLSVTNVVWATRILFFQRVLAEHLGFGKLLILSDKSITANSQAVKQRQTLSDSDKERTWKAPLEGED